MSQKSEGARPRGAGLGAAISSTGELLSAIVTHKMGWALPLVLVLLLLAGVLAVLAMVPAIAPFVYPLL